MSETPVIPAPPPPGAASGPGGAAAHRGPIRNALESVGMAVLMAILLKYFALEAYVIPTPSMQPTMMGSPEAGESDRILVDKLYYLLHEPKRWDIVVFRYPVRQVQSYVKRIVGVGGDRIDVAGGNLYNVSSVDKSRTILRKPASIQPTLWREIFPMRWRLAQNVDGKDGGPLTKDALQETFSTKGDFSVEDDGTIVGRPSNNTLRLRLRSIAPSNNYVDGYDLHVAKVLLEGRGGNNAGNEGVQDLAIGFELTPEKVPQQVELAIDIAEPRVLFSLTVEKGQGRLQASRAADKKTQVSDPFPVELAAGRTTSLRFEHLDDRLIAYVDGHEAKSIDTDEFRLLDEIVPGRIVPRVTVTGEGTCRFADLRIERDLHYTRGSLKDDELVEVPQGHFFMMGDNTLGSADGRDWTSIEIGIDAAGNIVNPQTHPDARVVLGNRRPKPFESSDPPHDDDNPVPISSQDRIVFVDEMGEIRPLHGKIDERKWNMGIIEFLGSKPGERAWEPSSRPARFVPRAHIQGRPIARFLRSVWPPKITGWIR